MKQFRFPAFLALASVCAIAPRGQSEPVPATTPAQRDQIVHVLNRITFGPRPGEVEAVEAMGLHKYIEQQLHPETIDDSAVQKELAQFTMLKLSLNDLNALYYDDRFAGREKKMEAYAKIKAAKETAAGAVKSGTAQNMAAAEAPNNPLGKAAQTAHAHHYHMTGGDNPVKLMDAYDEYHIAVTELEHAKLLQAVDSPRQLQEVLVDFWGNHFNIDTKKKMCGVFKVADDRDVIRPHIFGTFHNLLEASAKSPAMLDYLDNAENSAPAGAMTGAAMMAGAPQPGSKHVKQFHKKKAKGINENYAREIMELHTLGVDGGYTQKDVQEVARCFTGWTINQKTGDFYFDPEAHDNGPKVVLGHAIPANGGMKDGELVLNILCAQPACAHFISRELCQRFVSDNPPEKLVSRIAGVFTRTGGDLRAMTEAILTSPEFMDPSTYGNKIKSPFEFAVSAVRTSGSTYAESAASKMRHLESSGVTGKGKSADRIAALPEVTLNWHVFTLGQPLFACTPPTGYKEVSSVWVNPGALIERLNFALALTEHRVSDVRFSARNILGQTDLDDPQKVLDQCVATLLQGHISPATKEVLTEATVPAMGSGQTINPTKLIALIIGSPEFQRK